MDTPLLESFSWMEFIKSDLSLVVNQKQSLGPIFISSLPTAQSLTILQQHNINYVLSAARGVKLATVAPHIDRHLVLDAEDQPWFDLSQFFDSTYFFIEEGRKKGGVLVHCMAGISRSATIVAAYLMRKHGYSYKQAVQLLQARRKRINPNQGFLKQLKTFEKNLKLQPQPEKIKNDEESRKTAVLEQKEDKQKQVIKKQCQSRTVPPVEKQKQKSQEGYKSLIEKFSGKLNKNEILKQKIEKGATSVKLNKNEQIFEKKQSKIEPETKAKEEQTKISIKFVSSKEKIKTPKKQQSPPSSPPVSPLLSPYRQLSSFSTAVSLKQSPKQEEKGDQSPISFTVSATFDRKDKIKEEPPSLKKRSQSTISADLSSIPRKSSEKTLKKIERLKANMISSSNQNYNTVNFNSLLNSKIYHNKLRLY